MLVLNYQGGSLERMDRVSVLSGVDFMSDHGLGRRNGLRGPGENAGALAFEFRYLDLLFNNGLLQFCPLCLPVQRANKHNQFTHQP